jgi:phosphatidylglycerophosphatase A
MKINVEKNEIKNPIIKFFTLSISTGFGLGYSPFAPGTAGSLLGLVAGWYLIQFPVWMSLAVLFLATLLTLPLINKTCLHFGVMDSQKIVWDEVIGQAIGMLSLRHFIKVGESHPPWTHVVAAFVIFRLLDIFKPFPAKTFDRQATAFGVMADDVVAGLYTALILHAFIRLSPSL